MAKRKFEINEEAGEKNVESNEQGEHKNVEINLQIAEYLHEPAYFKCVTAAAKFMKVLVLMHGPPGSGKTTIAKYLQSVLHAADITCEVHSTDDYFMVNGEYQFSFGKLEEFHKKNFRAVMKSKAQVVIVDNTNLKSEYTTKYYTFKKYTVKMSMCKPSLEECLERNIHGVPPKILTDMWRTYTPRSSNKWGYFPTSCSAESGNLERVVWFQNKDETAQKMITMATVHKFRFSKTFTVTEKFGKQPQQWGGYVISGKCLTCFPSQVDPNSNEGFNETIHCLFKLPLIRSVELLNLNRCSPFEFQELLEPFEVECCKLMVY